MLHLRPAQAAARRTVKRKSALILWDREGQITTVLQISTSLWSDPSSGSLPDMCVDFVLIAGVVLLRLRFAYVVLTNHDWNEIQIVYVIWNNYLWWKLILPLIYRLTLHCKHVLLCVCVCAMCIDTPLFKAHSRHSPPCPRWGNTHLLSTILALCACSGTFRKKVTSPSQLWPVRNIPNVDPWPHCKLPLLTCVYIL